MFNRHMNPNNEEKARNFKEPIKSNNGRDQMPIKTQRAILVEFMKVLSLAHQCDVENLKGDDVFYNGPSPDEVALVEWAAS